MFEPTRSNCTIDGTSAKKHPLWDKLDWDRKEWREKASLSVVLLGEDAAPPDPHWSVPHIDPAYGTVHRVRQKRRK